MSEVFANRGRSTLNGSVTSGATSWVIAAEEAGREISSSGTFTLKCGDEYVKVTGRVGQTLTVVRGQEGSTAAAHADGAVVYQIISKRVMEVFQQSAGGVIEKAFSGATSVTVSNAEHGFGHARLLVQAYDDSSPRAMIQPDTVSVSTLTYLVTVTFLVAATGSILVSG